MPPVSARVYTPAGDGVKPLFVFYHGGGWVLGSLDESDGYCRILANATGAIVVVSPDGRSVTQLVAPEIVSASPYAAIAKLGLLADEAKNDLWACTLDTGSFASTLRRYDLATGKQKASFAMASAGGVCNDLAFDAKGNLYVTDSFFGVERLPAGGSALEVWKNDALLGAGEGQFAVDGVAVDGDDVWVDNLTKGTLVRIPITAGGAAGAAVKIEIKDATGAPVSLSSPDGIRLSSPRTLLVAEAGADAVSTVKIDPATNTAVRSGFASRLDRPSSVAIANGGAWIAEGQIARLFKLESTPVNYPFHLRRIPLH